MAREGVKITDRDQGLEALKRRVFGVGRPVISVGILEKDGAKPKKEEDGDASDLTVLEVAIWNEFGTDKIPSRSFIRAWFDENRDRAHEMLRRMMVSVVEGKRTKEQVLELLGQKFVAEIQARIAAGILPENAPSTVARKGSSKPLIATGQLRSSISYEVGEK